MGIFASKNPNVKSSNNSMIKNSGQPIVDFSNIKTRDLEDIFEIDNLSQQNSINSISSRHDSINKSLFLTYKKNQ